jgi:beta-mannosidase
MTTLPPGSVIGSTPTVWLHDGWQLARTAPGACKGPGELAGIASEWEGAKVPGTVAASIHDDINAPGNYDADDWWYRMDFEIKGSDSFIAKGAMKESDPFISRYLLRFEGLATLAEVWLNGTHILTSRNMFRAHRIDVTGLLRDENHLVICFRSLEEAMKQRRARPAWKTALVANQNLRWYRTTLLGRIPGWTPAITPVGPWGSIGLECVERLDLASLSLRTRSGRLAIDASVTVLDGSAIAEARVHVGDEAHPLKVEGSRIGGDLHVGAPSWWPHTHGTPHLVPCRLEVRVGGEWLEIDCGEIGFKDVFVNRDAGKVQVSINGVPVFCRGACWTTMDILTLRSDRGALRRALETARDAGINMLRVGGTMTYESNDFYRLCDELGILVWQDFMFANMDYPLADESFRGEVVAEVRQQLERLHRHPCVTVYCGGSEVAQQAAMLGLPAEQWSNDFFLKELPRLCEETHPGLPYFPSSPWGGALPIHVGTGVAHYYGIGAYRRPLSDVKTARVKFAAECLGFSNVPDAETMALMLDGTMPPPHHPRWKARVPRDNGSGYDFEDVRDHYMKVLFGEDPAELRSQDIERYYALSRVVSGEVMRRVYAEWRAPESRCGGALVWFYRDLWPGAGWGVTDSTGRPKAALWYLKRAWAPRSIHLTDEGLDGLGIHAINESPEPLDALIELEMYQNGRKATASAQASIQIPARGAVSLQGDALLGYFSDSTNAYRFGPPKHDVITVRMMRADTGELLAEDFYFPAGMDLRVQRDVDVKADAQWRDDGKVAVTLRSNAFLQAVQASCDGFTPDDNYFHLSPHQEKCVVFSPSFSEGNRRGPDHFKAHFEALNWTDTAVVRASRPG